MPPTEEHAPRPVRFTTDDGVGLAGELRVPPSPVAAIVVCHPHPLYGGDMHNVVPATLARELPRDGVAVLRFDFRGTGRSEGAHGGGTAEAADVRAALSHVAEAVPGVPIVLVGYSFGAEVVLAVDDPLVAEWIAIAPPLAVLEPEGYLAGHDPRPTLVLTPAHDQFCPPERAAARTAGWVNTECAVIPMADHFVAGGLGVIVDAVRARVATLTGHPERGAP